MIRTPNTSNTLVDTLHWLRNPLQLLTTCIPEQLRLLQYLLLLEIPNTYSLLSTIDIMPYYDRVSPRPGRNNHLNLGICGGEFRQRIAKEGALY